MISVSHSFPLLEQTAINRSELSPALNVSFVSCSLSSTLLPTICLSLAHLPSFPCCPLSGNSPLYLWIVKFLPVVLTILNSNCDSLCCPWHNENSFAGSNCNQSSFACFHRFITLYRMEKSAFQSRRQIALLRIEFLSLTPERNSRTFLNHCSYTIERYISTPSFAPKTNLAVTKYWIRMPCTEQWSSSRANFDCVVALSVYPRELPCVEIEISFSMMNWWCEVCSKYCPCSMTIGEYTQDKVSASVSSLDQL